MYKITNILITLGFQIVWFWVFHTYSGIVRYSTFVDITKLLSAIIANIVSLFIVYYVSVSFIGDGLFLRLGILLYGVFAFLLLMFLRVYVKTLYDVFVVSLGRTIPVVVYGTKSAGISIAKMLRAETNSRYRVVGFVDDKKNQNKEIFGLPIYSTNNADLMYLLDKKKIKAVVISPLKLTESTVSSELNMFADAGLQLLMIPKLTNYKEGDEVEGFNVERNLRKIQIEDLLGRKPIEIDKIPIGVKW